MNGNGHSITYCLFGMVKVWRDCLAQKVHYCLQSVGHIRMTSGKAVVEHHIPAVNSNRKWNCFLFRVWRHSHPVWNGMHECDYLVTIILSLTACWSWYEKWLNFLEKLYWHSVWCRKGLWDYLLEKWLHFHSLPIAHSNASWLYTYMGSITHKLFAKISTHWSLQPF